MFPVTILAAFHLLGVSASSLMWLVRVYVLGNVVLTYIPGSELFSRPVGAVAALFLTTSGAMYGFGLNEIDGVVAFSQLLALLAMFVAVRKGGVLSHSAAGAAIGVDFLAKETGLLLFLLPVAVCVIHIFRGESVEYRNLAASYLALLLTITPWAVYMYTVEGSITPVVGLNYSQVVRELLAGGGSSSGSSLLGLLGLFADAGRLYDAYLVP